MQMRHVCTVVLSSLVPLAAHAKTFTEVTPISSLQKIVCNAPQAEYDRIKSEIVLTLRTRWQDEELAAQAERVAPGWDLAGFVETLHDPIWAIQVNDRLSRLEVHLKRCERY